MEVRFLVKSKLFKDSFVYTGLNLLERGIPFLILPFLARILSKEEMGFYILYQTITEILYPLITLNIDTSTLLNYYKLDRFEFRNYLGTGFRLSLQSFAIFSIVLIGVIFSGAVKEIGVSGGWIYLVFLIVVFRFYSDLRTNLWRLQFKLKEYAIFSILLSILRNGAGILIVVFSYLTWEGMIIGHVLGYGVMSIFALISFKKENLLLFRNKKAYINDIFKIGLPLVLHKIGLWLGNTANRLIIASLIGVAATSSYGIGAIFGTVVTVIEDSFTKAFVPHLFEKLKDIESANKQDIVRLSYKVYVFLAIVSLLLFFIGYFFVGDIFGYQYEDTKKFIFPLVFSAMFIGFYKLHVNYIFFSKKTHVLTFITFSTGAFNILLSYVMVKHFGLPGAAYSLLIISIIQYGLSFYFGNKLISMPWLNFKTIKNG